MIGRATDHVEAGRYRSPFGYILVDEFQDISPARARLLKALLDSTAGSQLFAVGDDWQAIYRFGGSDIAVMREFGDRLGAFERIDLETTFRCSDRIAAVATDFVLRNPAQIRKTVRATRKANGPAVHVGLPGEDGLSLLKEALDRIAGDAARHDGPSNVLLLGRYRHLQPLNLGSLAKQYPGLRFTWMTVHRSKGLEADYAVVLGLCAGKYGFPVEMADDPLLDLVMAAPEEHANAEERRLLYVALTRARRQVFLLAEGGPPSAFARELIDGGYDITVFGRPPEGDVPCPQCREGILEPRENARDRSIFYGCTNWPYCEHTERPCPKCGTGLPGQGRQCPPVPRLRWDDRELPLLRRLAGHQNGPLRPLPRLLELSGLRLHAQSGETRPPFRKTVGEPDETPRKKAVIRRVGQYGYSHSLAIKPWRRRRSKLDGPNQVHVDCNASGAPIRPRSALECRRN